MGKWDDKDAEQMLSDIIAEQMLKEIEQQMTVCERQCEKIVFYG